MTTPSDVADQETIEQVISSLTKIMCVRLRADSVEAACVGISITDREFYHGSSRTTLISATDITLKIYEAARSLSDRLQSHSLVHQVRVHTSKASPEGHYQYQFLDRGLHDKHARPDMAVDEIRKRCRGDCMQRAVFVGNQTPRMSGSIDKVKRAGVTEAVQKPGPGSDAGDWNYGSGEDRVFR